MVRTSGIFASFVLMAFALVPPAWGVVLFDDNQPTGTDIPGNVVVRWNNDPWVASGVVIGPDLVLTAVHPGGGTGTAIYLGDTQYKAAVTYNYPGGDIRVVKVVNPDGTPADFTDYVPIYTGTGEKNQPVVFGGYGMGRGNALTTNDQTYGYSWTSTTDTLRWGTNIIDGTSTNGSTPVLVAHFNDPGATIYESAVAKGDSGGGWFMRNGSGWVLVGLSQAVEPHYAVGHEGNESYRLQESWYRDRSNPANPLPDWLYGIRVSSYSNWISVMAAGPHPGDANGDNKVDVNDLTILANNWRTATGANWANGDFNNDGAVDVMDLTTLATNWRWSASGGGSGDSGSGIIPEPGVLTLMVVGTGLLLVRRRRGR